MTIFGSINLLGKSEPSLRVHAIRQTQSAGACIHSWAQSLPSPRMGVWPSCYVCIDAWSVAADLIYHESACQAVYLRLKYPNEDLDSSGATAPGQQQAMQPALQQQRQQQFGVPQVGFSCSSAWRFALFSYNVPHVKETLR